MPAAGHATRRSESGTSIIREAAQAREVRSSRITLPFYKPPTPRILTEAAMEMGGSLPEERAVDVSAASFGSRMVLEVVIGNDDRVRIPDDQIVQNPFRHICALRIRAKSGRLYVGTGWFIGPRAVATAGHCVYMLKEDGWAQSIDVIPDKFGNQEPLGRFTSTKFRAVDGWTDSSDPDFDYGVILLDSDVPGTRMGWFDVTSEPDNGLLQVKANIAGYPADRDNANFQYFHARPISKVSETRLEYDIDTAGGQSGSPIWIDTADGISAVGIHTNGAATGNSGTRISDTVIENLIAWRDEQ